jgi:hypothetical protein
LGYRFEGEEHWRCGGREAGRVEGPEAVTTIGYGSVVDYDGEYEEAAEVVEVVTPDELGGGDRKGLHCYFVYWNFRFVSEGQ